MTTATLSSAAVHVVGQYNEAGKTLVGAYRAGVHRLLNGAASRYSDFLGQRQLPLLNDGIKGRLIGAQEKINGFLANRLDIDTARIVSVMERVAVGTTSGIESVAQAAARVESPLATSVLNTLGTVHRPIATVSVQIADRIAAGARQIEGRVAGEPSVAKVVKSVKPKAKPVVRRTARGTTRKA